jgi:hypothetical protein
MSYSRRTLLAFVVGLIWSSAPAAAQPIGTFRWQLQPFCNVLTLVVTQQNGVYTLSGTDDRCGIEGQFGSATGVVFLNPNGTVGLGLSTVLPGGTAVHLDATVSVASLGGTWRDSAGNSGMFVFTPGPSIGGPLRPVAWGGVAPGSITAAHFANGAVGASAITANAIASRNVIDGSLTGADLANGAIGAPQLAANAVTGANVVDGSLTGADINSALQVVSAESATVALQPAQHGIVVALPPFNAPAGGRVVVQANGAFNFTGQASVLVFCSITTGTTASTPFSVVAQEGSGLAGPRFVPFAGMRSFAVAAGSSTTFRLVCSPSDVISVWQPALTAFFIASP